MGAIPGVGIVQEPRVDGYLRGQVFNRPQPRRGEWVLFSIVYFPPFTPDWAIPSTTPCPDPLFVLNQPRDCYNLAAYSVSSSFFPRGSINSPLGSPISANFQFSPEEDADGFPIGNKVRTVALNLGEISEPYIFIEFRRDYSSGEYTGINPALSAQRQLVSRFSMSLARSYSGEVQPRLSGEYAPKSYYKFGVSFAEKLVNQQGDTNPALPRLDQQYISIGAFIDVRSPQNSHLAPSNATFAPFVPQVSPQGSFNQYGGSSLGVGQYIIDEGEI
jgi:hypothetical protein